MPDNIRMKKYQVYFQMKGYDQKVSWILNAFNADEASRVARECLMATIGAELDLISADVID